MTAIVAMLVVGIPETIFQVSQVESLVLAFCTLPPVAQRQFWQNFGHTSSSCTWELCIEH